MIHHEIRYAEMAARHVPAAALLRTAAGMTDPLAALGGRFWRLFLNGVVATPHAIAFVALGEGDDLAGYAIITPDVDRFHAAVLRGRRAAFAVACLRRALARPRSLPSLLSFALRPPAGGGSLLVARWITVVVAPAYHRRGVARGLFQLLSAALWERGVERFHSPVAADNAPSNALQESLGGEIVEIVRIGGKPHHVWQFTSAPLARLPPGHRLLDEAGLPD